MSRLGFPLWIVATHYLNILFLVFLARSGIQILTAFPFFYRTDHCEPGTEIFKFTKRTVPRDRPTQSLDWELDAPPWLALPGHKGLGIGRHWHFLAMMGWVLTGLAYVILLLVTDQWRRLVPTTWEVFPQALRGANTYLHFQIPAPAPGLPFNALQQLAYFAVVFLLAPFAIATGAAMSPAIMARAPWYPSLFGGKQMARTLHFFGLLAFTAFVLVHTLMVVVHGIPEEWTRIVLGQSTGINPAAVVVGVAGLLVILVVNLSAYYLAQRSPRLAQQLLAPASDVLQRELSYHLRSRQHYSRSDISPFHWINGYPPPDQDYEELARRQFQGYRLQVSGLVKKPLSLSLQDLREIGYESQIVKHNCIQGWSGVAEWSGVPLRKFIEHCRPLPEARYIVFHGFDDKAQTQPETGGVGRFYETLDMRLAVTPQTMLAWEMNGGPLPVPHGAPLRLRVETQLGFKMVKWIQSIEFVDDFRKVGLGHGGWREDYAMHSRVVGI
jgi:DMSO/TMAO reductase YedYZ molybdopterin-dependent catalytic subunit/thiosulfate reductase cytochrome b subunit